MTPQQDEFRAFYERTRDGCLRAVLVSTRDANLADDMVAEAYARAWARWPAVRRHPAPAAWVVRTALNTRVSWWRQRRREAPSPSGPSAELATAAEVGTGTHLDTLDVIAVVRQLPARQREVVALRVFLDLDTRTTAQALGIAEGTVTAHLHRALETVRRSLEPSTDSGHVR